MKAHTCTQPHKHFPSLQSLSHTNTFSFICVLLSFFSYNRFLLPSKSRRLSPNATLYPFEAPPSVLHGWLAVGHQSTAEEKWKHRRRSCCLVELKLDKRQKVGETELTFLTYQYDGQTDQILFRSSLEKSSKIWYCNWCCGYKWPKNDAIVSFSFLMFYIFEE